MFFGFFYNHLIVFKGFKKRAVVKVDNLTISMGTFFYDKTAIQRFCFNMYFGLYVKLE